ncbi:cytochrome c biogenesis protein ResB [Citricoccus zhacaiensis]|uniref:Cytochrome c biogenesis protein ResB n=2 Tax=Citricoccus TaxID=169133 RepID=A0ABV6F9N8_9MICC|nr:cytochrome c biogenesis protein ResB [Citricoccus zhacaiensis]VXC20423.1 putative Ccs1/ResB-related cytochrome C-type biogenesis protein [Citricoccus sp. K5]
MSQQDNVRVARDEDARTEPSRHDQPQQPEVQLPALGVTGTLRFAWTQLTSMRTALMLLLLLAVAAVPGSLFPQRPAGPEIVNQYLEDNPVLGEWLDRFQLFDVYSSVWFSAIYILLFVSLIGCVAPRAVKHAKVLRSAPPRTPRRLSRLPEYGTVLLDPSGPSPAAAVDQAAAYLRRRGYRVEVRQEPGGGASVGAERGYVREVGNIVFHLSLIGVLAFMAVGGLLSYSGQKILVEGEEGFANTLVSYDAFTPGGAFSEDSLVPFSMSLKSFEKVFDRESETHYGQPLDFTAVMEVQDGTGGEPQERILKVNHPLAFGGTRVYLVGNGYAPEVTVRDGNGDIAFQGPVVGQVQDEVYTSLLTIKVPDAQPDQLGFVGFFLPTSYTGEDGVAVSIDPELFNPELNLNSYHGDLGLDEGKPQNVYVLDTENLTELNNRDLDTGGVTLSVGESYELPEGKGSISFDGVKPYVGLDILYDPGKWGVGVFAVLALIALVVSLFVRRRRVWVRGATGPDGSTVVEYGLLARGEDFRLREENLALRRKFEQLWPVTAPQEPGPSSSSTASTPTASSTSSTTASATAGSPSTTPDHPARAVQNRPE